MRSAQTNRAQSPRATHHRDLTHGALDRHDELTTAIEGLERALAEAGVHRERPWSKRASSALDLVRQMIRAHAEDVEASRGLFDEIQSVAPRLSRRVDRLREEHASLSVRASELADSLSALDEIDVARLRRTAAPLLSDLRAHRASEADLMFEAFWMELGAAD